MKNAITFIFLFALIFVVTPSSLKAQHTQLNYKVMQGGNSIGWVKIDKNDSASNCLITLGSEIKKRMIFLFTIIENQEVLFQNGLMMRSYVYRSINKDIKANKRTSFQGTHYQVTKETSSNAVALNRIDYNFLSLYFLEPVNIRQVYSDNFEQLLNIEKISNYYKIKLPDGNTTSYYYTNGVCSKVKVEQSLFTIEFVLTQNPS